MPNSPFVGRQIERAEFRKFLDARGGPWIMWVIGEAGQGKSEFLQICLSDCRERDLQNSGIIDLFDSSIRSQWGLLRELSRRFELDTGTKLRDLLNQYYVELNRHTSADSSQLLHIVDAIEDEIIDALKLKQTYKPCVILVDTIEEMSDSLAAWFFEKLLPRLYSNVKIVAAGRQVPLNPVNHLLSQSIRIELPGLTHEEIREYFKALGVPLDETKSKLIYRVTRGNTLSIAVLFQALLQGSLKLDDLSDLTDKSLTKQLDYFFLIDTPEKVVLLCMAHVYNGLDIDILSSLYTKQQLGISSFDELFNNLIGLPFVKQTSEQRFLRLHDSVREQVNERIWPQIDPHCLLRAEISEKMVKYYEIKIGDLKKKPIISTAESDLYQFQSLYHMLFSDRASSYRAAWDLLTKSWYAFNYEYMNLLLDMIVDVNDILKLSGHFDEVLDRLVRVKQAWLRLEEWNTKDALKLSERILADETTVRLFKLSAVAVKGIALGREGSHDEAITALREAYEGYEDLLSTLKGSEVNGKPITEFLTGEHNIYSIPDILAERYLILNAIGVLYRQQGHFENSEEAFRQCFELSRVEGNLAWQASASTQLGTILRFKGDFASAYDYIHRGLAIRRKLGQKGREAFSLQALGMLQRDDGHLDQARVSLNEALNIWKDLGAEVDIASVLRNLGWIDYLEQKYDQADKHYSQAEEIYLRKGLARELPNLRQKQGALWVSKAGNSKNKAERIRCLIRAETLLREGLNLSDEHSQPLYSALCLIDLCRISEMYGDYEKITQWEKRIRVYEKDGYHFELAYADLEEILGKVSEHQARMGGKINYQLFDDATDHYCQMFVYLARFSSIKYRQRREFLHKWLRDLPDQLRHRACKRLIECWQSYPELVTNHSGFIATVQAMHDL